MGIQHGTVLLRRQATEARGSGGSGSSSTVMGEVSEDPSSHCRNLQKEWIEAEFSRLADWNAQEEVGVDTVDGDFGTSVLCDYHDCRDPGGRISRSRIIGYDPII